MDTAALEAAYRAFLDIARPGGFAAPADRGAWTADRIVAHVVANDRLLAATTARLLGGQAAPHTNAAAFSEAYLDEIGRAADRWEGLVATARACALEVVMLARRLDQAQASTPIQVRLLDGDEVRMESPMPWSGVITSHAEVALPSWGARLADLSR